MEEKKMKIVVAQLPMKEVKSESIDGYDVEYISVVDALSEIYQDVKAIRENLIGK